MHGMATSCGTLGKSKMLSLLVSDPIEPQLFKIPWVVNDRSSTEEKRLIGNFIVNVSHGILVPRCVYAAKTMDGSIVGNYQSANVAQQAKT